MSKRSFCLFSALKLEKNERNSIKNNKIIVWPKSDLWNGRSLYLLVCLLDNSLIDVIFFFKHGKEVDRFLFLIFFYSINFCFLIWFWGVLGLLDGFYGFGVKIDKKKIDFMDKPPLNFSYHGSGRILNNSLAGNMSPV